MDNSRTDAQWLHAAGGVTTEPVGGGGGGEAGPEVIIPLSYGALTASLTQALTPAVARSRDTPPSMWEAIKALQAAMEDVVATGERLDAELRELKKNVG